MPIRVLPPEIVNKIAAGEVVERPASVVKELVENALDASASEVRVEILEGGIRAIQVVDNGTGIPAEELPLAVQRHATSKIARASDLEAIRTLGFRGEALAAIAAVSRLTLTSRHQAAHVGRRVVVEGGRILREEPAAHPVGTTVTVEHLFFNTPARRKFLKAPRTEARHVHRTLVRYALAFPEVRFSLVSDGKEGLRTSGNGRLLDVVALIWGPETARQLLPVGEPEARPAGRSEAPTVWGLVGRPELTRPNAQQVYLFVNRRWVWDRALLQAVVQAYHTLIPADRYPVAILFIELSPDQVDVNVHPTKAEVRFRDPAHVFAAVQKAVRAALTGSAAARPARDVRWSVPPGWAERRRDLVRAGAGEPAQGMLDEPGTPELTPKGDHGPAAAVPILRVVGQVGATYIVAEGPDGLYLIDQHAAHERVLFERLRREWREQGRLASQQLLDPVPITLSKELGQWVADHVDTLRRLGFEVEPFGPTTYLVRAVPAVLAKQHPERVLEEVLLSLAEDRNRVDEVLEERLILHICKGAAVKAGQVLSLEEMRGLVRDLESCETPHTCPHGRPTLLHISASELARQFNRGG